jgi:hypothetical protein
MNARNRALLAISLALMAVAGLSGWTVYYKEQYYKLWHEHYIQYPDDIIENIAWLERAKEAPFCNPLYAIAKIENKKQWERYRYLLDMHLDLKLIEAHLALGSKYDKRVAYFFNAPWKDQNLESLKIAESAYKTALAWWPEAKDLAAKAMAMQFVDVEGAEFMADEAFRITTGDLDFGKTIQRQLDRVAKVRTDFEKMDASTY